MGMNWVIEQALWPCLWSLLCIDSNLVIICDPSKVSAAYKLGNIHSKTPFPQKFLKKVLAPKFLHVFFLFFFYVQNCANVSTVHKCKILFRTLLFCNLHQLQQFKKQTILQTNPVIKLLVHVGMFSCIWMVAWHHSEDQSVIKKFWWLF